MAYLQCMLRYNLIFLATVRLFHPPWSWTRPVDATSHTSISDMFLYVVHSTHPLLGFSVCIVDMIFRCNGLAVGKYPQIRSTTSSRKASSAANSSFLIQREANLHMEPILSGSMRKYCGQRLHLGHDIDTDNRSKCRSHDQSSCVNPMHLEPSHLSLENVSFLHNPYSPT